MHKFFLPLFGSTIRSYVYHLPIEIVRSEIELVFVKSKNIFGIVDIKGGFTGVNEFYMQSSTGMIGHAPNVRSILFGVISPMDPETTEIAFQIAAQPHFKLLFWTGVTISLVAFYQALITGSLSNIVIALLVLLAAPFLVVKFAIMSNVAVEDRYRLFIHKRLKKKEGL